jgi:ABC-type Mn2+/Zn2+ transport system ATPase subunit
MNALLELTDISVLHGDNPAISHVSFDLRVGELIALIGPNGAGKSTLLQAIVGLINHDGTIRLAGRPCHHGDHRYDVAYIPQRQDLDRDFPISTEQLVMAGRRRFSGLLGRTRLSDRIAVADSLERVGASHLHGRHIGALSGGEFQRVLLARALAQEASLILLDEAFSGIDQPTAESLIELLTGLSLIGTSVLVATHDLQLTRRLFPRCLAINQTLIADGHPSEVLRPEAIEATFARVSQQIGTRTQEC